MTCLDVNVTLAALQILIDQFKIAILPSLKGIFKIFWTPTEGMLPFRAIYFSTPCGIVKLTTFQTIEIDTFND